MHALELNDDGKAKMAYAASGGVPWHGLGTPVGDDLTPKEMMDAADVNWKVRELSTFAEMSVGGKKTRLPTGLKALVRETDGKVLTQVGKNWKPVQNEDAFAFFDDFVKKGEMTMETAGALDDGRIVWAMARLKDEFTLFGGKDCITGNLLFTNPHIYGRTVDIRFTPIRVVCANTLSLALQKSKNGAVSVNHRAVFDAEKVKEILGMSTQKMGEFKEASEFLCKVQFKSKDLEKYFGTVFGFSEKEHHKLARNAERAMSVIDTQPGAEFGPGSYWAAFNTVTYMIDHELGRTSDTRMQSAWYGVNRNKKIEALNLALDMAKETV